jgi:NitT/TauT family transport system ATP-binding protein
MGEDAAGLRRLALFAANSSSGDGEQTNLVRGLHAASAEGERVGDVRSRNAIEVKKVDKDYPSPSGGLFRALEAINLTVASGEFIALVGPSGCGKTSILRLIAALETPTAGEVLVNGEAPQRLAERHCLAIAFQDHALLPWLTVEANLELPFHIAGRKVDRGKIADLLALVRLSEFARSRPRQLSGGMRQRVAIARALTLEPEVLLLDEPFGALDAVTRRHLNIELERIWSRNRITTVLVTHSVQEALFLADTLIIMGTRPGRILKTIQPGFPRQGRIDIMRSEAFHKLADELVQALEPEGASE